MKKLLALCAIVVALSLITGCPPAPTPTGTKPATTTKPADPTKPEPTKPVTTTTGEIAVAAGLKADVEKSKDVKVMVKITRKDYKGAVEVTFDAGDTKVTADKITIAEGKDEGEATLKADKEAKSGDVKVTATGKDVKEAKGMIAVTVK